MSITYFSLCNSAYRMSAARCPIVSLSLILTKQNLGVWFDSDYSLSRLAVSAVYVGFPQKPAIYGRSYMTSGLNPRGLVQEDHF